MFSWVNQIVISFNLCRKSLIKYSYLNKVLLCLIALATYGCVSNSANLNNNQPAIPSSASSFGLHDVTTFDVSVTNDTIHLLIGGKISANDKKISIRYLQSQDGGNTWSKPVTVANPAAIINNRGNDIQIANHGDYLLALWQNKGELPGMGPLVSAYSTDNGNTWIKGKNPAINDAGDQSHADIIADKSGVFYAVWLEDPEENGYQSLRYSHSRDHGKTWGKAQTIEDSTCSCCWNTLTLSPNNAINVYYRDMKPRDMALMRFTDNGVNWRRISTVGAFGWQFDGCPHVGGALSYADAEPNRLYSLSWTGIEGKSGLYVLASNDNGLHWSAPVILGKQALHGDLAVIKGKAVAVWDEMTNSGSDIFYAPSDDGGKSWSAATKLSTANGSATHPRLAATSKGLLALWTEKSGHQLNRLYWRTIQL
ncbi:MAG: exo-alpha-sialidase [Gammaproteobacteria bacterium]|nr:exo-alpha-sialidase [Gammaproteobacteria bacterium]